MLHGKGEKKKEKTDSSSFFCQHRHDDLYHRLPKFLVLHTLLLLCKQQLFLTNHEFH